MFKISHEVPTEMLRESSKFNDYDYALVHLFEDNVDYFMYYKEAIQAGRTVILDNSAYELGEPMSERHYQIWIEALNPTEFIVPDYRNDSQKTIEAAKLWKKYDTDSITIGVVHGETYLDFCICYLELAKVVDKISFSFEDFFTVYQPEGGDLADARIAILKKMVVDGIIDEEIPHHILGCLHPTEYKAYVDYSWIESVDTSNPVIQGIIDGKYPGCFSNYSKSSVKLADLIDIKLTDKMTEDILYNIKWFRDQFSLPLAIAEIQAEARPERYASRQVNGMDVIDLVKHWNLGFNEGNILKYLLRDKGEDVSDIKKIIDYAQRELKHLEK